MAAKKIQPPGAIIGGMHVSVEGSGARTVVLEAGIAASSLSWSLVQRQAAQFARVIAYDRAGFGWSDADDTSDGTALYAAMKLNELLRELKIDAPVVMAGHSFGGLVARVFQQRFPAQVAAMVLVDPVVREEWRAGDPRLARGAMLSRRGATLARIGIVGLALKMLTSGSHRIPQFLAKASAGRGAGVADRLVGEVRKMPKEHWPAIAMHWSEARSFEAMAKNLEQLPVSVAQVDEGLSLGNLPLIVLSAKPTPEHARDAALSTHGVNIVVPDTGHWIQLDQPRAVVDAIRRACA